MTLHCLLNLILQRQHQPCPQLTMKLREAICTDCLRDHWRRKTTVMFLMTLNQTPIIRGIVKIGDKVVTFVRKSILFYFVCFVSGVTCFIFCCKGVELFLFAHFSLCWMLLYLGAQGVCLGSSFVWKNMHYGETSIGSCLPSSISKNHMPASACVKKDSILMSTLFSFLGYGLFMWSLYFFK